MQPSQLRKIQGNLRVLRILKIGQRFCTAEGCNIVSQRRRCQRTTRRRTLPRKKDVGEVRMRESPAPATFSAPEQGGQASQKGGAGKGVCSVRGTDDCSLRCFNCAIGDMLGFVPCHGFGDRNVQNLL